MKIIKHCSQTFPTTATGFIVGMDKSANLEVTNSFPFPTVDVPQSDGHHDNNAASNLAAAAPRAKANVNYQTEMIKKLREVNVDANNTGWYTSANLGNFVNINMIENQHFYQKELNERTVAIVHDVSRSSQGSLSLRAFRLSPAFTTAYKEGKFTTERYAGFWISITRSLLIIHLPAFRSPTYAIKTSSSSSLSQFTTRTFSPRSYIRYPTQSQPKKLRRLNLLRSPLYHKHQTPYPQTSTP
jgi:hypothetical protein